MKHPMVFGSALKYRNFRLFFFGQGLSLVGTWMQQVAMIWLVYRLSGSAFLLGLVGFCSQVPILLFSSLAGVYTDRWNRHRTIIVTQSLAMLQAVVLVALTLTGVVTVWQVILLSIFLGMVNAFDMPARQAFLIQMIEGRDHLPNAIGLNSSMFNAARLVGPALAGFLIAAAGEWLCFLINAISYVAVLAALLAMRVAPRASNGPPKHVLLELKDGFLYAFGFHPIRALLLLLAIVSLAAMPLLVLMPIFATNVLHGGPQTLGLLTAAMGVGALAGALLVASRKTVLGLGRQIAWSSIAFAVCVIAFSFSSVLWISLVILAAVGFSMMMETAATNTILQTIVEEDKRGRVMSFYATAFVGMAPLGSLLAGSLASRIGAVHTVQLAGAQRMGILPELTSGMPSAADTPIDVS
ncbi:MAG: MFS transporter [Thermoguttaceae bacterium]